MTSRRRDTLDATGAAFDPRVCSDCRYRDDAGRPASCSLCGCAIATNRGLGLEGPPAGCPRRHRHER